MMTSAASVSRSKMSHHGEREGDSSSGCDHDDVKRQPAGVAQRRVAGGAAVDRDEEACSLPREAADRVRIRTIAFEKTVGNVNDGPGAAMGEIAPEQRRRRGPVDVIVAEDRNPFPAHHCIREPPGGRRHVGERVRIRHERAHARIEEDGDFVCLELATRKNARQELRDIVALRDRKRAHRAARVEPVAPGASARGALDAQKKPPARAGRS